MKRQEKRRSPIPAGGRPLAIAPPDRGDNDAGAQYRDPELLRLRHAPRSRSPYDPDATRPIRQRIRQRFGWT